MGVTMSNSRSKTDHGGRGRTSPLYCKHCDRWSARDEEDDAIGQHDPCIDMLPGNVMNACCGHGEERAAYVQKRDGTCIRGEEALAQIRLSHPRATHQPSLVRNTATGETHKGDKGGTTRCGLDTRQNPGQWAPVAGPKLTPWDDVCRRCRPEAYTDESPSPRQ